MPSSGVQTCALRSEEHTSELQSLTNLVCRLLLEKTSDFNALIPEGFNGLRGYLIEKLKHKNGKAVGIEIAGPGSTLFHDLSKNHLFGRSAGFVLSDARITQRKAEDDTINHQVVEVSDAFSSKGYRKIEAWLGEEKADFIIERMVANMNSFPTDPEY